MVLTLISGEPLASGVINDSDVAGATVKDVLDSLDSEINNIVIDGTEHGQLYTHDGTATLGLTAGNEAKLTLFTSVGLSSSGVTPSADDDEIRVTRAGIYLTMGQFSIKSSVANTVFGFCGAVDNVSSPAVCTERKVAVAGDVGSCSIVGAIQVGANGIISVRVTADKDTDLTLVQGQLQIRRME